jgi:ParB-like chromosome segregation protein Spo0J
MTAWRDSITVRPLADTFPMMSDGELKELAEDIKKNGQREPVVFVEIDGERTLIDGRNRLAACAMVGVTPWATTATELKNDAAVRIYIISQNVHRRHLTPEQRQAHLEAVIIANPEKSDREIAREAKLPDHKKVGRARKKLESTGAIAPVQKRTGKDDKTRKLPAKKVAAKDEAQDVCNALAADFSAAINGATPLTPEASAEERKAPYAALDTTEADTLVDIGAMPLVPAASPIVETAPQWLQLSIAAEPADMAPKILEAIGAAKAAALITELQKLTAGPQRARGRPPGSKNKPKAATT